MALSLFVSHSYFIFPVVLLLRVHTPSEVSETKGHAEGLVFDPEIVSLIHQLWQDPVTLKVMDHGSEFYLVDSAS
jgi:hypothetical protein